MQSTQLRNIQNIENSLSLLKSKIDKMAQLDSQKQQTLDRLILNTIPVVDKKIQQERIEHQIILKKSRYGDRTSIQKMKNQQSRMINQKQINKSKEWVSMVKQHNSMHLKKSKKINQQKIKKIKELNLSDKKEQKLKIKQQEQKAQLKIKEFHQLKQKQLKERRQKQNKENQHKIQQLMKQLNGLGQKQIQLEHKLKTSDQHIHKFRTVVHKMDKMKCQQFSQFRNQVMSPQTKKYNSRCLSEAILLYTAAKNA